MAQAPWRAWFVLRPVRARFVVNKVALGQVFQRVPSFSLVSDMPPPLHTDGDRNTAVTSV